MDWLTNSPKTSVGEKALSKWGPLYLLKLGRRKETGLAERNFGESFFKRSSELGRRAGGRTIWLVNRRKGRERRPSPHRLFMERACENEEVEGMERGGMFPLRWSTEKGLWRH